MENNLIYQPSSHRIVSNLVRLSRGRTCLAAPVQLVPPTLARRRLEPSLSPRVDAPAIVKR
jgi:hypothetical protein